MARVTQGFAAEARLVCPPRFRSWAHTFQGVRLVIQSSDVGAQHPYRERAWCALILALYRSGRQADALAAAGELRQTLAEGLGLDPSPEARELEDRILRHDAALARPLPPPRDPAGARTQVTQAGAPQRVTEDAVVGRRGNWMLWSRP